MSLRYISQFRSGGESGSFNMTPIIDIVFLLIIFFLVVCQFVEPENLPVVVPDDCEFAQSDAEPGMQVTTLTVARRPGGKIIFAVGSEELSVQADAGISGSIEKLAGLINVRLRDLPPEGRVVTLRIDKDVCYADAQYALAAVAASSATDIQLAVLRGKAQPNDELTKR